MYEGQNISTAFPAWRWYVHCTHSLTTSYYSRGLDIRRRRDHRRGDLKRQSFLFLVVVKLVTLRHKT